MSWFGSMKINGKFSLILTVFFAILLATNAVDDYLRQQGLVLRDAADNARILARQIIQARDYMSSVVRNEPETNYNLVPQVVATQIAKRITEGSKFYVRQVSLRYRNPDNRPDPFETKELERFAHGGAKETYGVVNEGGRRMFRYMLPMEAQQSCLRCHGRYEDAPRFVQVRFPKGHPSYNYRVGEVIGAVSVSIPMADLYRQIGVNLKRDLAYISGLFLLILLVMSALIHRFIIDPVRSVAASITRVAATGSFSDRIPKRSGDEIGELVDAFNELMAELDRKTKQRTESEDRYQNVLEMAQSAIVTFLADGKLVITNQKAERLFGLPKGELLGASIYNFIEDGETVQAAVAEFLRQGSGGMVGTATLHRVHDIRGEVAEVEMALSMSKSDDNPLFTAILRELSGKRSG